MCLRQCVEVPAECQECVWNGGTQCLVGLVSDKPEEVRAEMEKVGCPELRKE